MSRKLLIDAAHREETRVVITFHNLLEDFESETSAKKQIKGNVYLAKVIRVEPSLQAAFVDFGHKRHGFLPFAEIHPQAYTGEGDDPQKTKQRIQDVIKRKQVLLVQAIKEERGTKGAAFSTYVSLAGRYCVLMPNAGQRSGGVSRKIMDDDRKRLQDIVKGLDLPETMGIIVRTASQERTKIEIKRDLSYLIKLWDDIQDKAKDLSAPSLILEEGNLIKKAIRDIYTKDIEEIIIEGEEAYKEAKTFMKMLMPSHVKKVRQYKETTIPLFQTYQIEEQIYKISEPTTTLRSGGTIVIAQTEALVAIDVNSAKSTKERGISETALKTNLEAADEIARQIRLRDLAGLIVIDFIDMADSLHVSQVERRFKDATKADRARIQIGRISAFGLLELSRQRLRPSFQEAHTSTCPHCSGLGVLRSIESSALYILRQLELEVYQHPRWKEILVHVPDGAELYLLNHKRPHVLSIETKFGISLQITKDRTLLLPQYRIDVLSEDDPHPIEPEIEVTPIPVLPPEPLVLESKPETKPKRRRRRPAYKRQKPEAPGEESSPKVPEA